MRTEKPKIDIRRTQELGLSELLVLADKGDEESFSCIPAPTKAVWRCPKCGSRKVRNQGNMHRKFLDIVPRREDVAIVTVSLNYTRYKCLSPECGAVFYPEFTFASPYSRTTLRLDDVIVKLTLMGCRSFSESEVELRGKLSRQTIGQIFHRRLKELESDSSGDSAWFRQLRKDGPAPREISDHHGEFWRDYFGLK